MSQPYAADPWIRLLGSADEAEVRRGLDGIVALGPEAFEALLSAPERGLWDGAEADPRDLQDWYVQALAVLGKQDPEPLIRALRDGRHELVAVLALGETDSRALEVLVETLGHAHPVVRWSAVQALGRLQSRRAVDPLIRKLRDRSSSVRAAAAAVLGKLGAARALPELERLARRTGTSEAVFAREAVLRIRKREEQKRDSVK